MDNKNDIELNLSELYKYICILHKMWYIYINSNGVLDVCFSISPM